MRWPWSKTAAPDPPKEGPQVGSLEEPQEQRRRRAASRLSRAYAAAVANRLTSDWNAPDSTADMELEAALPILRQRARDLERNNDYVRRFFHLLTTNVVGKNGIRLQANAKNPDGSLDKWANKAIEEKWAEWCKVGSCTVCGRYSFIDVLKLCLRSVARDGEILVYMPPSWKENASGFALQLIEADHLDIRYNATLANGNTVRMGVESNRYKRPVAYHVLTKHPAEVGGYAAGDFRERLPAEDVVFLRLPERVDETRSAPWIVGSASRLRQIAAAEEAEVVAWRIAASKMGFYVPGDDPDYDGDDEDTDGNPIQEAEPGVFELLKSGWDFKEWNPDKPSSTVETFLKAELRGVSSGLNVSYHSLANDLEGVSFSSIRSGEIGDRDHWGVLQTWLIDHLCAFVYKKWLKMSLTTGFLPLNASKFDKYLAITWNPRGWEWVDPQNESQAAESDVRLGVESLFSLAAKRGKDLGEVMEENARARAMAKEYGIDLEVFQPKTTGGATAATGKEGVNNA